MSDEPKKPGVSFLYEHQDGLFGRLKGCGRLIEEQNFFRTRVSLGYCRLEDNPVFLRVTIRSANIPFSQDEAFINDPSVDSVAYFVERMHRQRDVYPAFVFGNHNVGIARAAFGRNDLIVRNQATFHPGYPEKPLLPVVDARGYTLNTPVASASPSLHQASS